MVSSSLIIFWFQISLLIVILFSFFLLPWMFLEGVVRVRSQLVSLSLSLHTHIHKQTKGIDIDRVQRERERENKEVDVLGLWCSAQHYVFSLEDLVTLNLKRCDRLCVRGLLGPVSCCSSPPTTPILSSLYFKGSLFVAPPCWMMFLLQYNSTFISNLKLLRRRRTRFDDVCRAFHCPFCLCVC